MGVEERESRSRQQEAALNEHYRLNHSRTVYREG